MSLNSEQRDKIRDFLRTDSHFYNDIWRLRDEPFEFPDAQSKRGTLQDAAATKPRRLLQEMLLLSGLILTACGGLWEHMVWHQGVAEKLKESQTASTLQDLQDSLIRLLSSAPETLAQKLAHSIPLLCTAIGILLLIAAAVSFALEVPAHQADPLFARLLQSTLGLKLAPSNRYVQLLLANLRFKNIFQRAISIVFPLKWSAIVSPEWQNFVTRLLDGLEHHEPFVHFVQNHSEASAEELYSNGLREHLEYGIRQLLFTEMLADPDCAFLYRNTSDAWRKAFHWISTADIKKLTEYLPQIEKSSGGTNKATLTAYLLIALLVVSFLAKLAPQSFAQDENPKQPARQAVAVEVKFDTDQLAQKLGELTAKLCQPCGQQQSPTSPPPISITLPKSPGPTINIPPSNIPSKIEVAISSATALGQTQVQQNLNVAPTPARADDPHGQKGQAAMQGDTLVSFTRSKSINLKGDQANNVTSAFVLHNSSGIVCSYKATLLGTGTKWPPDPVQIRVLSDGPVAEGCPVVPADGATISVSREPLYNDVLKAYIGIDEEHSRHIHVGRDQIVVLIHYPSETSG